MKMGTVCLKLLLSVAVIFTVPGADLTSETLTTDEDVGLCIYASPEHRLQLDIMEPKSYDVEVIAEFNLLAVRCKIMLQVYQPTGAIRLHAYKIQTNLSQIQLMTIEEATKDIKTEIQVPVQYHYCKKSQILELHFKESIKPAHYYLEMNILVSIQPFLSESFIEYDIKSQASYERWFYTNLLKPIEVRRLFPCWDETEVKTTFNISVMHPEKYRIILNTPIKEQRKISASLIWTYFMLTPPITASDLAIVITDNDMIYATSVAYYSNQSDYIWHYPESTVQLTYVSRLIDLTKWSLFKYTNMTSPVQHIIIPSPVKGVIGRRVGLIIYRERDFLYQQNESFVDVKLNIILLIAKQLAYQMFDKALTGSSCYDAWISDSFTTFFSYFLLIEDLKLGEDLKQLFTVQILQTTLYYENVLQLKPVAYKMIDEIDTALYSRFYHNKGVVFLRMLQHIFGPQKFGQRLKDYMSKYKSNSAAVNYLWEILQGTDHKENKSPPLPKDVIYSWSQLKHYPVLYVSASDENVNITSTCVEDSNCLIPIQIHISNLDYDNRILQSIWMQCNEVKTISKLQWNQYIMLNLPQIGYYRVNYEINNWQRITIYLLYKDYINIPVEYRAQLIDDAYYFLMTEELDLFTFWNLVKYLKRETNYIAWYPMFNILFYMSAYWKFPGSAYAKTTVVDMLEGLLENIGYEEHDSNNAMTNVLRLLASKWSCQLGSSKCREAANVKLLAHYYSPKTEILPWWKEWVYSMGIMQLNQSTWNNILHESLQSRNITILKYLDRTNNITLILNYLNFLSTDKNVINIMGDKQRTEHYRLTVKRHLGKDRVRKYVLTIFSELVRRYYPYDQMVLWGDIIWNIYSENEMEEIIKFSKEVDRYLPGQNNIETIVEARKNEINKIQVEFSMI